MCKSSNDCCVALKETKRLLATSWGLVDYDPDLMKMAADASANGVGDVISHVLPDGTEKPIAFAS